MSTDDLARSAVERLNANEALRGELDAAVFGELLDHAVIRIMSVAARGGSDFEAAALIKEAVAALRDDVEAETLARRSPKKRRLVTLQPEARRP